MMQRTREAWWKNWPELRAACCGDLPQFITARRPREPGESIPVFCYHLLDSESFAADLEFLQRNGYSTLDADELADHMEGLQPAPRRSVVLTIDDGLGDLYSTAFPLLKQFNMTAVAFIAPALHPEQAADQERNRLCTWQEIMEMHISGLVDFQAHTLEHRYIPAWPRPTPIRGFNGPVRLHRKAPRSLHDDFALARRMLETRLVKRVEHLAFPQFDGTAEAVRTALACRYRATWWGLLPGRKGCGIGDPLTHIVRFSGDFLRRLPGEGRITLAESLRRRYHRRIPGFRPKQSMPTSRGRATQLSAR